MKTAHQPHAGLTLLERLLALALASLVFAAVAMAIDLQLRTIDAGRTEIEEAQLARALLRRMADDLRGAVQHQVIDFSSLESLAPGGGSMQNLLSEDDLVGSELDGEGNAGQGQDGQSASGDGADGFDDTGGSSTADASGALDDTGEEELSSSQNIAATAAPAVIPGVYGNQYELQIDVSRLPRPEEFGGVISYGAGGAALQAPSDIKTVSYYLRPPGGEPPLGAGQATFFADDEQRGGLVRREIDRAVARYAADTGDTTLLDARGELIAPEVTGLEFQYFDGVDWLTEWDSELMGGLPVAVEIAIAITPRRFLEDAEAGPLGGSAAELFPGEIVYRMVVRLPAAKPAAPTDPLEELGL